MAEDYYCKSKLYNKKHLMLLFPLFVIDCVKSPFSHKRIPTICHCEEQSFVAISNFIYQKLSFRIFTAVIFTLPKQ